MSKVESYFNKYVKTEDRSSVQLMYLILNGFDLSQVETIHTTEEDKSFGIKIRKVYGNTKEYVDVKKIEREIENTQYPTICSPVSFELYSKNPRIYLHQPMIEDKPLVINDMGVISRFMIITEDRVISSNEAKPISDTADCGFTFFMQYVLKGDVIVGKWHITYINNVFNISYLSEKDGEIIEESLYTAIEMGKTTTFKMVIYIIRKVASTLDDWAGDNFETQSYELLRREENGK